MSMQNHAIEKVGELKKELQTIAKWFSKTHGGPDISDEHLSEMPTEQRVITAAMIEHRQTVAKELSEWQRHIE